MNSKFWFYLLILVDRMGSLYTNLFHFQSVPSWCILLIWRKQYAIFKSVTLYIDRCVWYKPYLRSQEEERYNLILGL